MLDFNVLNSEQRIRLRREYREYRANKHTIRWSRAFVAGTYRRMVK